MLYAALVAASVVSICWCLFVAVRIVGIRHAQEYREPSTLLSTGLLLAGQNPYSFESRPVATNLYGIAYPCVVLPLAKVMGASYPVHRGVSLACVIGACAVFVAALRRSARVPWVLAVAATALLLADLCARVSHNTVTPPLPVLARPDGLGELLLLVTVLVPLLRGFSRGSLALSAVAAAAALLSKPYFVFGAPVLASWLFLFRSKRSGVAYGGCAAFTSLAALAVVALLCPAYLNDTFYVHLGLTTRSWTHAARQWAAYAVVLPGCLSIAVAAATIAVARTRKGFPSLTVAGWDRPLLTDALVSLPAWGLLCSVAVITLSLGRHTGNWMSYYVELLSPFLLFTAATAVANAPGRWRSAGAALLLVDLVILLVTLPVPPRPHTEVWEQWATILRSCRAAYVPPVLADLARDANLPIYEGGYSEYFDAGLPHAPPALAAEVNRRHRDHILGLQLAVRNEQLDLIALPRRNGVGFPCLLPGPWLDGRYRKVADLPIPMDYQPGWSADVYVPVHRPTPARIP